MKIVQIIPQLSSGGAERFVVDLCNELSRQGHQVYLLCLYSLDDSAGLNFYLSQVSEKVNVLSLNKRSGFDFSLFKKLKNQIKKIAPDIVHSHLRSIPYLLPIILTNSKIKYFHTIHNDAKIEASDLLNRTCRKYLFNGNKCTAITISKESDDSFIKYYGTKPKHILIVNGSPQIEINQANPTEFNKARKSGKKIIVNIARLNEQKNQMALVEAMASFPDIELFIIGNDESDYARQVKSKAPDNVHILGQRSNPRDYMAAADAFILSSIYEGMPISLIECFSVGQIPLVTPVGGMVNMIKDHNNGLIAHGTETEYIVELISRFNKLSTSELTKLHSNSRLSFNEFTIEKCAAEYINIYTK